MIAIFLWIINLTVCYMADKLTCYEAEMSTL